MYCVLSFFHVTFLCDKVREDDNNDKNGNVDDMNFVNMNERNVNVNKLKVTSLPYNTNVKMPQKLEN